MILSKLEYDKSVFFYKEIMNAFNMDFSLYVDLIDVLQPKSIMEIGCGMGRLFPIFMKTAELIAGIDLSTKMLSKAQHFLENSSPNIMVHLQEADMRSFSLGEKYDLIVVALSVLKHLRTGEDRFKTLENAKNHLKEDGFILIDNTPFLYTSKNTDWIDAKDSMVAKWLPDSSVLEGYEWKKSVEDDLERLEWRYRDSGETQFEVDFTTYRYDTEDLVRHITDLELSYEVLLTEWGVNGITDKGKRFIGLVSHPGTAESPKEQFLEKVTARNERLWSDYELYTRNTTETKSY